MDHGHAHSIGQRNADHFDKHAATVFDEDWVKVLCDQIFNELRREADWIGLFDLRSAFNAPQMLDYACGNGLASRALSPWFSKNIGIDISKGMVDQFNQRAKADGFSEERMHAIHGDLVDASSSSATTSLKDFPLVVMSMALHHVDDPTNMIKLLAEKVHPNGGTLLIIDWVDSAESGCKQPELSSEAEDHPAKHTTSRQGFKEEEVKKMFEEAGLGEWGWKWAKETSSMPKGYGEQRFFFAKGVRKAS